MKLSRISLIISVLTFLLAPAIWSTYMAIPGAAGDGPSVSIVTTGLHNPRGLNFGPDGGLYVAEAAGNGPHGPNRPRAKSGTALDIPTHLHRAHG